MSEQRGLADISSKQDLVAFIRSLRRDLDDGAPYWQNTSVGSFLDAMGDWVEGDLDEYLQRSGQPSPAVPSWRLFAEILDAGAMIE